MTVPEPTPQAKALKRVLAISRFNGWSVVVIAGLGALLALVLGDLVGAFIGLLAAVAGWMEVRGHRMLRRRDPAGMTWLVRSQMFLLSVILVYCITRLGSFDADTAMGNLTPDMEAMLKEAGLARADILPMIRTAFLATYLTVAVVSIIYQGGMALYYRGKTRLVTAALAELPLISTASAAAIDQLFYDAVAAELAAQNIKPGLWARALAETTGEEVHARAAYIRLRVDEMKRAARPRS